MVQYFVGKLIHFAASAGFFTIVTVSKAQYLTFSYFDRKTLFIRNEVGLFRRTVIT